MANSAEPFRLGRVLRCPTLSRRQAPWGADAASPPCCPEPKFIPGVRPSSTTELIVAAQVRTAVPVYWGPLTQDAGRPSL